jgi:hypothetical protein
MDRQLLPHILPFLMAAAIVVGCTDTRPASTTDAGGTDAPTETPVDCGEVAEAVCDAACACTPGSGCAFPFGPRAFEVVEEWPDARTCRRGVAILCERGPTAMGDPLRCSEEVGGAACTDGSIDAPDACRPGSSGGTTRDAGPDSETIDSATVDSGVVPGDAACPSIYEEYCDGECVEESVAHCGPDCATCPGVPNGVAICQSDACGIRCDDGFRLCDGTCAACPTEGVSVRGCDGAACIAARCEPEWRPCDGGCCHLTESWTTELTPLPEAMATIAVDAAGVVHIAYASSDEVVYARREAGVWTTETAYSGPRVIREISMAVDGTTPVIAFFSGAEDRSLFLARRGADGWSFETVADSITVTPSVSLAIDASGRAHLAHSGPAGPEYTWWTGTEWSSERIPGTSRRLSLALTSTGQPVVAANVAVGIQVARRTTSGWMSELEVRSANRARIAIDASDHIHVVLSLSARQLQYVRETSTGWVTEDLWSSILDEAHIAIDAMGRPHVAANWWYAFRYDSSWHRTISPGSDGGLGWVAASAFVFDSGGAVHMVHTRYSDPRLYYSTRRYF